MKTVATENLYQLMDLLQRLSPEDYTRKPEILSGASIGQHVRHIVEFYLLLVSGSFTDVISYDKRERDIRLESNPEFAMATINAVLSGILTLNVDSPVFIEADYTTEGASKNRIASSVGRELAYCIEHSIHHQALIKAGLIALGLKELTDGHFGVAYSTIRFLENKCAQ